jgi:hypothetical protein
MSAELRARADTLRLEAEARVARLAVVQAGLHPGGIPLPMGPAPGPPQTGPSHPPLPLQRLPWAGGTVRPAPHRLGTPTAAAGGAIEVLACLHHAPLRRVTEKANFPLVCLVGDH